MVLERTVAVLSVSVGYPDGEAIPGYSRTWKYTNRDQAIDHVVGHPERFHQIADEAANHFRKLMIPGAAYWLKAECQWLEQPIIEGIPNERTL